MKVGRFIANSLVFIVPAVLMVVMLRLGFWQLERAEFKQNKLTTLQQREALAELNLNQLNDKLEANDRFRRATVTGFYKPEASIFMDNRVVDGKVGYDLLTPLLIEGSDTYLLVNRGWLPAGNDRSVLPDYQTPQNRLTIAGRFNLPQAEPAFWKPEYAVDQGAVWQFLPLAYYQQKSGLAVLPLVLELAPNQVNAGAYLLHWQGIDDVWIAKHHGYAFQWFMMAAALLVCFVLLIRAVVKRRQPR